MHPYSDAEANIFGCCPTDLEAEIDPNCRLRALADGDAAKRRAHSGSYQAVSATWLTTALNDKIELQAAQMFLRKWAAPIMVLALTSGFPLYQHRRIT